MTDWVIAIPAWGKRCMDHFEFRTLPAIQAALAKLSPDDNVRFIVHTDQPERVQDCLGDWEVDLRPRPDTGIDNNHIRLGNAHREVLAKAKVGEAVAFINADMVCSVEAFAAAGARIKQGKKLIMCMGTRTAEDAGEYPPIGVSSRELLQWAWDHRHGWITGCIWGTGRTKSPTVLYFPLKDGVVLHAFHLHPFVVVKEHEALSFSKVTVDCDLVEQFPLHMIHVVTDADELSFAEISPFDYQLAESPMSMSKDTVAAFARNVTNSTHRWFFSHRIVISGICSDMSEVPICSQILSSIDIYIPPPTEIPSYLSKDRQDFLRAQQEARRKPFEDASMFHVALPAWGERHMDLTCNYIIPALRAAVRYGDNFKVHFMAYSDQPDRMREALDGLSSDVRYIPTGANPHDIMTQIHHQSLAETPTGHVTVLLTGDIIPSRELFSYAVGALKNGRRAVATMAPRVLLKDEPIPIGVSGRELLAWVWRNRHPITEACVWGRMLTTFPNCFYFENGDNVVMHSYHLHPFMVMKDRHCTFVGTVDDDLLANFENHEIAYVQEAEVGFAEISTEDHNLSQYGIANSHVSVASAAHWARNTMPAHLRNFSKALRVTGFGEVPESANVTQSILAKIVPSRFHPPPAGGWESMPKEGDPSSRPIAPLAILS